ncbi:uncharacterized protein LOC144025381 isoform X1 [Festucalex cinctus]
MDRYRYFIFNQKRVLVLGVLQVACAALCMICGFMDAVFRKDTPLSTTRTPLWGGMKGVERVLCMEPIPTDLEPKAGYTLKWSPDKLWIMACPGVLALFASQRKNAILVSVMVASACLSCVASVFVLGYSSLTLTYGEEDKEVFHHHDSPKVTFVLHRMVKGANATMLLICSLSLLLSSLIAYAGCCSLPRCGCYDARTGLETLVPQCDPGSAEMVCTWQAEGDDRLFNSPVQSTDCGTTEEDNSSKLPPYSRLT